MTAPPRSHDKQLSTADSQMPRRRLLTWLSSFGLFASVALAAVSDWLFFSREPVAESIPRWAARLPWPPGE